MQDPALGRVRDPAHKESQFEEGHSEEKLPDLDYLARIAERRDSRQASSCKEYSRLQDTLTTYMKDENDIGPVKPSKRMVVDVMDAAGGASEEDVIHCLDYLRIERGLTRGSRNGPRGFGWFKSAVGEYFHLKHSRELVYKPNAGQPETLSTPVFDEMTSAFDTTSD